MTDTGPVDGQLRRELGVPGAVMLGLGSMVGTGVFVSTGLAAEIAGPAVILAIALAAGVAACNGLSSAQLAAAHPVSGGTYAYGYRFLTPALGFTAGWMFLAAKSASAATAALGFAGYLLLMIAPRPGWVHVALALTLVGVLTVLVLTGIRRTSGANIVIVSITLAALVVFILAGLPRAMTAGGPWAPFIQTRGQASPTGAVLHATALMFVAYTGYGRIATLGEEVRRPRRTIPIAIITTLIVTATLYLAVSATAVASVGARGFAAATRAEAAPLAVVARTFHPAGAGGNGWIFWAVSIGAVTAMGGVLLNLLLGLSRVVLAMGRGGDLPAGLARVTSAGTPTPAVIGAGVLVAGLVCWGSVSATWSFSAFTVLIYYGLTNLACLKLPAEHRLYPRGFAWMGLIGCLFLAWWVEPIYWLIGVGLIGVGLSWRLAAQRIRRR